jgi:hypothetical protein
MQCSSWANALTGTKNIKRKLRSLLSNVKLFFNILPCQIITIFIIVNDPCRFRHRFCCPLCCPGMLGIVDRPARWRCPPTQPSLKQAEPSRAAYQLHKGSALAELTEISWKQLLLTGLRPDSQQRQLYFCGLIFSAFFVCAACCQGIKCSILFYMYQCKLL